MEKKWEIGDEKEFKRSVKELIDSFRRFESIPGVSELLKEMENTHDATKITECMIKILKLNK